MATAGPLNHTSYLVTVGGGAEDIVNEGDAATDNGTSAAVSMAAGAAASTERVRGNAVLNFAVTGTPLGLSIRYEVNKIGGTGTTTLNIYLLEGTSTTVKATKTAAINAGANSGTVGGAADSWGSYLSSSNMNNLRIAWQIDDTAGDAELEIDHIGAATLTYTPPVTGGMRSRSVTRLRTR